MVVDIDVTPGSPPWFRLARIAKLLSSVTLVWLGIEGAIGVVTGVLAGSIALHRHLALHGKPDGLRGRRAPRPKMGGDQLLPACSLRGRRSDRNLDRRGRRRNLVAWHRSDSRHARDLSVARSREAAYRRKAWLARYLWRGNAKRAVCHPRRRCAHRIGGKHAVWSLDPAIALAISAICVREGQKAWRGDECGCATCS